MEIALQAVIAVCNMLKFYLYHLLHTDTDTHILHDGALHIVTIVVAPSEVINLFNNGSDGAALLMRML